MCPTAFKETLSAVAVADAIVRGLRSLHGRVEPDVAPLSDGGDGLLDALAPGDPTLRSRDATARDPLGRRIPVRILTSPDRSVIETARVVGLALLGKAERDPLRASTEGVGDLVAAVGATPVVLGLGGSATVDGGVGMARALGWRFLDARGRETAPGGGSLASLARIVPPSATPRFASAERPAGAASPANAANVGDPVERGPVRALADVRTPLVGPDGAARVFAPQKGASPEAVSLLEDGLAHLAQRIRQDLGVDVSAMPGGGAAGGLGAGAVAFLGARLTAGSEWVLDSLAFDRRLAAADIVVTGEGAWDGQSGLGKIVGVVVDRCVARGVPVVVVAGRSEGEARGVVVRAGGGRTLAPADIAELAADGVRAALGA